MIMAYEIKVGSVFDKIKEIGDESIDCVVTSPPYFNLRDYGKENQIGTEKSLDEYIKNMVSVFEEVKRVLKPTGTVWLNLGDTYKDKNLLFVPHRVVIALQDAGWICRNDIVWEKSNAMPMPVKDRLVNSHEYLFLLTKQKKYFYDVEAIREPYTEPLQRWGGTQLVKDENATSKWDEGTGQNSYRERSLRPNKNGKHKRTVWRTATSYHKGVHCAVYPPSLIEPCILAGSPKGGMVLDIFAGSGTTGGVAEKHGRDSILIELNEEYAKSIPERIRKIVEEGVTR
jgi:site-specific DNA-methyltransferase (adenine-specific)